MNERIKELWGQATFDESRMIGGVYHPYIPLQYGGEPIRYSITEDQIEKLAELIVKECANVAADHDALDIYEEIREHFGVE